MENSCLLANDSSKIYSCVISVCQIKLLYLNNLTSKDTAHLSINWPICHIIKPVVNNILVPESRLLGQQTWSVVNNSLGRDDVCEVGLDLTALATLVQYKTYLLKVICGFLGTLASEMSVCHL